KSIFQFRLGLFLRDAGIQTTHDAQPPHVAGQVRASVVGINLWFQCKRYRHFHARAHTRRAVKASRRDTNHSEGEIVEIDLFADDGWIAAETFLPVAMTQNNDWSAACFIVFISEQTTECGLHSECGKIIS